MCSAPKEPDGSVLIEMTLPPAAAAISMRPAAGYTVALVPTTIRQSTAAQMRCASFHTRCGNGSPNQTTAGRRYVPQARARAQRRRAGEVDRFFVPAAGVAPVFADRAVEVEDGACRDAGALEEIVDVLRDLREARVLCQA